MSWPDRNTAATSDETADAHRTAASGESLEDLLRRLAPQVLGALMRRYGALDTCEDAVQEALIAAAAQWPEEGMPGNPYGWLVTVATRRLVDWVRSDSARRRREDTDALATPGHAAHPPADEPDTSGRDDSLTLLFLCCHPALSPPSQIALTLRAVGGLTTAEIARAFLVPEATMAQRISRAKQSVRKAGGDVHDAAARRTRGAAARRAARAVPHAQRGPHHHRRARVAAARPHR